MAEPEAEPEAPRLPAALRADATAPIVAGLALVAVGFVGLALAWGRVAGVVEVHAQLPWAIGGGAVSLALVMVGLTTISVQSRRRDAAAEERQLRVIAALARSLPAPAPAPAAPSAPATEPAVRRRERASTGWAR